MYLALKQIHSRYTVRYTQGVKPSFHRSGTVSHTVKRELPASRAAPIFRPCRPSRTPLVCCATIADIQTEARDSAAESVRPTVHVHAHRSASGTVRYVACRIVRVGSFAGSYLGLYVGCVSWSHLRLQIHTDTRVSSLWFRYTGYASPI